jgi:hypothetical protein
MNLSFFTDSANYSADYSVRHRNKKYTPVHLLTTTSSSKESELLRGASKIKLKNVNKKRMATARRIIFFNFSRHPLLITLLFSSIQNSGGSGDGNSRDSCADPCLFLPFLKTKT